MEKPNFIPNFIDLNDWLLLGLGGIIKINFELRFLPLSEVNPGGHSP
jgi:hypothetical protein